MSIRKDSIKKVSERVDDTTRRVKESTSFKDDGKLKELTRQFLLAGDEPERLALLLEFDKGSQLTGENGIRKRLGAIDLGYFGKAYLPHYFSRPSPEFHRELDRIWRDGVLKGIVPLGDQAKMVNAQSGCKRAVAAPRGHAKSTNLTFKDVLHAVLYEYKHYAIILADTFDQASGFLSSIKDELDDNAAIKEDFGELAGAVWREDVIVTKTKIKIEAIGAGQKIRGRKHKNWRPDLLVLDDVENDDNVRTPEQRKKLENWFYKAVSKAGDSYTDIMYIGTMLHYDSLLAKVLRNPSYRSLKYKAVLSFSSSSLWDTWEAIYTDLANEEHETDARAFFEQHREEMLKGTAVLWEDKLSYYDLMTIRVSEGEASFNSELQNEPINPDDCLFNEEWFDFYNPLDIDFSSDEFEIYGFVDPSLGKNKKADFSAIITLAKHKPTGYMYDLDADIERRHPDVIINDVLAKAEWLMKTFKKKYRAFGCEVNQFQWFLKEELAKESARRGIYLPITEVTQTADKALRVQTLQPDVKNKYLKFNRQHKRLLEQLKFFPMADHDDGPDALEACRTLANKGRRKIKFGYRTLVG